MQKLMRKFQFLNPSLNVKVKIKKVRIHKHKSMHYCTCQITTLLDSTNNLKHLLQDWGVGTARYDKNSMN